MFELTAAFPLYLGSNQPKSHRADSPDPNKSRLQRPGDVSLRKSDSDECGGVGAITKELERACCSKCPAIEVEADKRAAVFAASNVA